MSTRCIVLGLAVLAGAPAGLPAQAPPAEQAGGLVRRVDGILSQTVLVDRALEDLLQALQKQDVGRLGRANARLVRAEGLLADRVTDAALLLGQAEVRLELSRAYLDRLRQPAGDPAGADLAVLRHQLLGHLQQARERYEHAAEADRPALAAELGQLTGHLEQIDLWAAAVRQGQLPLLPAEQLAALDRLHRRAADQLAHEDRLLQAVARSLAGSAAALPRELRRSLTFLRAEAAVPHEPLARLQQQRAAIQQLTRDLRQARADLVRGQPAPGRAGPADVSAVLRRADAYLQPAAGGQ